MNFYFYTYNNRFNNLIKKPFTTLAEYGTPLFAQTNVANVHWGDGIVMEQVINTAQLEGLNSTATPDYCVITDDAGNIDSRWFVSETHFNSSYKYVISLHRDTIADEYDKVLASTCYVEKGYLPQSSDLIYQDEGVSFNQIKKAQYLLKSNLGKPCVVAYLKTKLNNETEVKYQGSFNVFHEKETSFSYTVDTISNWEYYKYLAHNPLQFIDIKGTKSNLKFSITYYYTINNIAYDVVFNQDEILEVRESSRQTGMPSSYRFATNRNLDWLKENIFTQDTLFLLFYSGINAIKNQFNNDQYNSWLNKYNNTINTELSEIQNSTILVVDEGNKAYKFEYSQAEDNKVNEVSISNTGDSIAVYTALDSAFSSVWRKADQQFNSSKAMNASFIYVYWSRNAILNNYLYALNQYSYDFTLSPTQKHTVDSQFEILALPFDDSTKNFAILFMQNLALDSTKCVDIQIVPYIGVNNINTLNFINIHNDNTNEDVKAYWLEHSSFNETIILNDLPYSVDVKKSINCDLYRLCSPNGQGSFEFSPARNGGEYSHYIVDCTLQPSQPYINVHPLWNGLYGSSNDTQDYRGLICSGSFSLPQQSDAWLTYISNNVNYQNIFDRQIADLEYNNSLQKTQDIANAIGGTVAAAGLGVINPGLGLAGGLASGSAGAADVVINDQQRQRQLESTKLNFNWNIGNIKAQQQSVVKAASLDNDNTFFPYIEYYTCTETETTIFQNKLLWEGYTVRAIAPLKTFLNHGANWTYIKASMLETDIAADTHYIVDINQQLSGGIRIET